MIAIEAKVTRTLRGDELALAISRPLREIGVYLATAIRDRASRGRGSVGNFRTYETSSNRLWLPPASVTAIDADKVLEGGRFKGWAIWDSRDEYLEAHGKKGRAKRYEKTGKAWASLNVRQVNVRTVRVGFRGTHRSGRGRRRSIGLNLADASEDESRSILYPSRDELARAGRILRRAVNETLVSALKGEAGATLQRQATLRSKVSSAQRRLSRLAGSL